MKMTKFFSKPDFLSTEELAELAGEKHFCRECGNSTERHKSRCSKRPIALPIPTVSPAKGITKLNPLLSISERLLSFMLALNLQDQPLKVQKEYLGLFRELKAVVEKVKK